MKKLLFIILFCSSAINAQSKWFAAYYATWSMLPLGSSNYACPPWEIDYRGLTDIILFDNGNVTKTSPYWAYMFSNANRPADTESDSIAIEYNAVAAPGDGVNRTHYLDSLVAAAHRHGTRVVITIQAVAGTTPCLNYVASDSVRTQTFVNTCVAWAERKHLDGVELDWEGWSGTALPSPDTVAQFLRILHRRIHTMTTGLGQEGIIQVSAGSSYSSKYKLECDAYVDQYNLQLYDYAFAWYGSPVNAAVAWHISPLHEGYRPQNFEGESYETRGPLQWIADGHQASKIGLGIPTYGYILRNVDTLFQPMTNNADYGSAHYQVIEALKGNGGTEVWDDVRKVRNIHGTALRDTLTVYYQSDGITAGTKFLAVGESPRSIREKVSWLKAQNLGGIMIYDYVSGLNTNHSIGDSLRNPLQYAALSALGSDTTSTQGQTTTVKRYILRSKQ